MYTFNNLKNYVQTLSLLLVFSTFSTLSASPPVKISVLQIIEHPALDASYQGMIEELKKLGYADGSTMVLDFQTAQGNTALATQIAQKFASHKADVIVAIGTTAAQAAVTSTKGTEIPVVFTSVTDPVTAKLVTSLKAPEGRVTGVSDFVTVAPHFAFFKRIHLSLKTLGIIYNPGEANSVALIALMEKAAKSSGLTLVTAVASKTSDVLMAAKSLCGKVDALFVNNDNTALSAFASVVKAAKECGIPAFVSDVEMVPQGATAALGPDQKDIGRQTARIVDRILKNPKGPMPAVEFPQKTEEVINPLPAPEGF